jgi:hypothetical protein
MILHSPAYDTRCSSVTIQGHMQHMPLKEAAQTRGPEGHPPNMRVIRVIVFRVSFRALQPRVYEALSYLRFKNYLLKKLRTLTLKVICDAALPSATCVCGLRR